MYSKVLSASTAVSFGTDATAQPYENENAAFFALATLCWPILFFVAYKYTLDTNYFKEETVVVPVHVRKELQGIVNIPVSDETTNIRGVSVDVESKGEGERVVSETKME